VLTVGKRGKRGKPGGSMRRGEEKVLLTCRKKKKEIGGWPGSLLAWKSFRLPPPKGRRRANPKKWTVLGEEGEKKKGGEDVFR